MVSTFFRSKHLMIKQSGWRVVYLFYFLKQLVFLVLTAEGWWYIRQSVDFALSPHDVINYPNAPPPLC